MPHTRGVRACNHFFKHLDHMDAARRRNSRRAAYHAAGTPTVQELATDLVTATLKRIAGEVRRERLRRCAEREARALPPATSRPTRPIGAFVYARDIWPAKDGALDYAWN